MAVRNLSAPYPDPGAKGFCIRVLTHTQLAVVVKTNGISFGLVRAPPISGFVSVSGMFTEK